MFQLNFLCFLSGKSDNQIPCFHCGIVLHQKFNLVSMFNSTTIEIVQMLWQKGNLCNDQ